MLSQVVMPKINKTTARKVPGLWGTLGMMNDTPVDWQGNLKFSEYGNDSSGGVTLEEIELIYSANPQLDNKHLKVTERFISFEDVEFGFPSEFTLDEIPKFRLTLMLDADEGALVYYQYGHTNDRDGENGSIGYIQPEKTTNHNVDNRDRLTYLFEALPSMQIVENTGKGDGHYLLSNVSRNPVKFLIKVLTYKRGTYANSKEAVLNQTGSIAHIFEKESKLVIFKNGSFVQCQGSDVQTDLKTLLLIHGTFSTTAGSYGALIDSGWLQNMIDTGSYGQVIGFDHPTVFEDAVGNINTLISFFAGMQFLYPVDVMGSSQGGLLAQHLANLPAGQKPFVVDKVALVASANGVAYVNTAYGLSKMLSVLKVVFKNSKPALALICSLAQHSIAFFIGQPGIDLMKPGSQRLTDIMDNHPDDPGTKYLPIIDDFTKEVVKDDNLFAKLAAMGFDLLIRPIMGKYNDWVVQTPNQFIVPAAYSAIQPYNPGDFLKYTYPAIHGKCLDKKEVQTEIGFFLA
ncbi:MAG TPA: hypothetical protein DD653_07085 [Marinilabiliales bacterium]|nr:hypothetical protein [Marinilabiliales bacterium]